MYKTNVIMPQTSNACKIGYDNEQPCLIEEFFKKEQEKPAHLRSNSCLIACPCPRHRVYC